MPSSIPEISQLTSRCILRKYSRSLRYGHTKASKPLQILGLIITLLVSWNPLFAQMVPVNGPIALPATNVASSSAPQNLLLKTTSAETISGFTVPLSQGNKQEYTVGTVSGCAVDGVTSNPVGTVCTVPITFSPAYPGQRPVPLQVVTSAGKVNIGLNGTGVGPLVAFAPGIISTLGGTSPNGNPTSPRGDGGPATAATFFVPKGMAVDNAGNIYIADDSEVRRIDASTGIISGVAGVGRDGGDGGPASSAAISPTDVALDSAGDLYITDNTAQSVRIRKVDGATGIITTVAGASSIFTFPPPIPQPSNGDGGPATQAILGILNGVALDLQGNNLYFTDSLLNQVRRVDLTTGIISTIAGTGTKGYTGDGGPAASATLDGPQGIAVDLAGNVYFSDYLNGYVEGHVVRRVDAVTGIITTYAGNPSAPYTYDPTASYYPGEFPTGPANSINIEAQYLKFDSAGNLYITGFDAVRRVDAATNILSAIASTTGFVNSQPGYIPPAGKPALGWLANTAYGIALDGAGNFYITSPNYLQKIDVSTSIVSFPTLTHVGTTDATDGPQSINVANIGNAPLSMPPPASGANPNISTGFTGFIGNNGPCPIEGPLSPSPGTLAQGDSCGISVEFEPVSVGSITGSIVLTDNSLNAASPYATQTISLVGTAIAATNTGSLTIAPTAQAFASTAVGSTSTALTSTITNTTSKTIYLSSGSLTDATDFTQTTNCTGIISANGGTCTVTFTFTPQTPGSLTSTYAIHDLDYPQAPLTVALSGNGTAVTSIPQATLSPSTADFGSVTTGTASSTQTFTLSNTGSASLGITSISLTGANSNSFLIVNDSCASSAAENARPADSLAAARGRANPHDFPGLPSAGTCQILVVFSPTSAGPTSATLTVVDQAGTQTSTVTGTGVASAPAAAPDAALTAASANFNSVVTGSSAAQTFTLANAGNAALSITSVALTGANASSFQLGADTCGTTLAAGGSCTIAVTFSPATTGSFTASLSVIDALGTQASALSGTGVAFSTSADFTIAANPAAQTSYRGASVTYTIQLASASASNPFTNSVTLAASGLPAGATAAFSPASVVPSSNQPTSAMQITIPNLSARDTPIRSRIPLYGGVLAASLFSWFGRRRKIAVKLLLCLCALGALGAGLAGCGTGNGFALPNSTSTIVITGTSGSITHSTSVTLTIQ